MTTEEIKFYMQKEGEENPHSIEGDFGLSGIPAMGIAPSYIRYAECEGLKDKGKRTNVYTEKFATSNELHVWMGSNVVLEPTTIKLTLYFIGPDRDVVYDTFYNFVNNGKVYYWDTKRLKKAFLILTDKVTVKEDVYKGSTPYILVEFKFQNLWGECKNCDKDGNIK